MGLFMRSFVSFFSIWSYDPPRSRKMRAKVNCMTYDVSLPIDTIFNAVQGFGHYCLSAGVEETYGQAMAMVLRILTNSGHLTEYFDEWDDKTAVDRTWDKMQQHFHKAHKFFCKHTDATVSSFGANNTIIKGLLNAENEANQQMEQHMENVVTSQEQSIDKCNNLLPPCAIWNARYKVLQETKEMTMETKLVATNKMCTHLISSGIIVRLRDASWATTRVTTAAHVLRGIKQMPLSRT